MSWLIIISSPPLLLSPGIIEVNHVLADHLVVNGSLQRLREEADHILLNFVLCRGERELMNKKVGEFSTKIFQNILNKMGKQMFMVGTGIHLKKWRIKI